MKPAVTCANYLKTRGDELIPRGPTVEVIFDGEGPIGIHIVNIPYEDGPSDRVVVAATGEGAQAENRIFFGEQVMQVNGVSTRGMKMKEVKLMIADAERPIRIVLQPLCFRSTRHEDFPLCPPMPPTFTESEQLWRLLSRPHALVEFGPEKRVEPKDFIDYISMDPEFVFIRDVKEANKGLMQIGERIIEVDGRRGKHILQGLLEARYPGTVVLLQPVVVSGTVNCSKCNKKEWVFSKFCSHCGCPQKARRT